MSFFELRTPRDMLEKSKRERVKLCKQIDIDNVFNFFVTAYHIRDYINKSDVLPQTKIEEFFKDSDLRACRDLCNQGKHMTLTRSDNLDTNIAKHYGRLGGARLGLMRLGHVQMESWTLCIGGKSLEVKALAERIINKYEQFFEANNL